MKKRHVNTSIVVSCDFPNEKENDGILIVGRPHGGQIDILNAFDGKEARDIWDKLITVNTFNILAFIESPSFLSM